VVRRTYRQQAASGRHLLSGFWPAGSRPEYPVWRTAGVANRRRRC
jgi:hypothetical protein